MANVFASSTSVFCGASAEHPSMPGWKLELSASRSTDDGNRTLSLTDANGREVWVASFPEPYSMFPNDVLDTIVVDGHHVSLLTEWGYAYRIDLASGEATSVDFLR